MRHSQGNNNMTIANAQNDVKAPRVVTPTFFSEQDPIYGKGKLGEIQGLILGMLDTFNYEQVSELLGPSRLKVEKKQ